MEVTPRILVVSSDPVLEQEVSAAVSGLAGVRAVIQHATSHREGLESVRNRRPDLVLVEMGAELAPLRLFADEVQVASPDTAVVAVYQEGVFGDNVSEGQIIIEALRAGISDFLRRPVSSRDLSQFLERLWRRRTIEPDRLGRIVTFFTNKGGVGKSTLSLSTACALAKQRPGRVLLVDASIQLGVCSTLLDLQPRTTMTSIVNEKDRLDATLVRELSIRHESGLHLLAAPYNALEASLIDDEVISRVLNLARRSFDFVIVDTFPMIDKVMMAVLDLCDRAYLVTESVVPTLEGTARMLEVLDEIGMPAERRRLVLNRYSSFVGNIHVDDVKKRMGFNIDHVVPYEKKLLVSANIGEPFILTAGMTSRFRKAIMKIADEILALPTRSSAPANGIHATAGSITSRPGEKA